MKNSIVGYRRTHQSPWVAIPPNVSHRSLNLFLAVGTYVSLIREDGTVEPRK